jgi:phage-related protein
VQIVVLKQAQRELKDLPKEAAEDVFALFEELTLGRSLLMPISRPLPSIAKGLHELRLSGRGGEFRVFYVTRVGDAIYVLHAVQKKKQELDKKTRELLLTRLRSIEP